MKVKPLVIINVNLDPIQKKDLAVVYCANKANFKIQKVKNLARNARQENIRNNKVNPLAMINVSQELIQRKDIAFVNHAIRVLIKINMKVASARNVLRVNFRMRSNRKNVKNANLEVIQIKKVNQNANCVNQDNMQIYQVYQNANCVNLDFIKIFLVKIYVNLVLK